jgi:hypothetical protein
MNATKCTFGLVLMLAVCLGTASAEHRVSKKKKVIVSVEQDENCLHGISVSDPSWGDRQLCTDYPDGAASYLEEHMGSQVEVEAQFTYDGDPKITSPIGINKVYRVSGKKVFDPCAIGKMGMFAMITLTAGGADPAATAASLTPGCAATNNQ